MGKPFAKEISENLSIYNWSIEQNVEDFRNDILNSNLPLFIVGSGGSLSACHYAAQLYQQHGQMAKAVTPLELIYSKNAFRNSNVLFISASGKNTDIIFSYKTAINNGVNRTYSMCMNMNSSLSQIASKHSISSVYEFDNPAGKDGFLATNSLVGFFGILYKALEFSPSFEVELNIDGRHFSHDLDDFISKINSDFTFTILYAGWGQPVAIDIESKLAEAALGDVLFSDYRNFGHGRHHWFDKRKNNSAIIALITPTEEHLAQKTLSLLPKDIPILMIDTKLKGSVASIELLIKSFKLVQRLGEIQNIDPGKPGVPEFGSKLYKLNYQKMFAQKITPEILRMRHSIELKASISSFENLKINEKHFWIKSYNEFLEKLSSIAFGSIIFDYDGTICSSKNRLIGPDEQIGKQLIRLLEKGIIIGIATGRGQSVRKDLQKIIPQQFWNKIFLGYYNCSSIGLLSDNNLPDKTLSVDSHLESVYHKLQNFKFNIRPELKPDQITIEIQNKSEWKKVREAIIQFIQELNLSNIQILESSHSMDIVNQRKSNKLNILEYCSQKALNNELSDKCLCIGDKGKWPGNDFQLLSSPYSLSVDEVSMLPDSCWNFSPLGLKNIESTIYYLSCLKYNKNGLIFKLI